MTDKELEQRLQAIEDKLFKIESWIREAEEIGEDIEALEDMGLSLSFVPDAAFLAELTKKKH